MSTPSNGTGIISGNGDDRRTLVVVFLRGGADGLTLAPPIEDREYYRARPNLSISKKEALKLDGRIGLHPSLKSFQRIFREGALTVVPGTGSEDDTRSHFYAQDLMEHGGTTAGGWLGRFLRYREGAAPTALSAIALGTAMPECLRGAPAATVMESMDTFSLGRGRKTAKLKAELASLYGADKTVLGPAARDTLQALDRIAALGKTTYRPDNRASYAQNTFANGLKQTAQLVKARVGLEAVSLDLGGWDSHFAQESLLAPLVVQLSDGLGAFYRDLGESLMQQVTVVVMTEFGRRVQENSSFGTDHGRGGVMFVVGGGIGNGRVAGTIPDLDSGILVGPGDVPVVNNYRDVLIPVLRRHGASESLNKIFPGHKAKLVPGLSS